MVGVTVAQQFNAMRSGPVAASLGAGAGVAGGAGAPALGNVGNPWGPRAYGMGLNNPWAMPVNSFMMRHALNLIETVPNALVVSYQKILLIDGDIFFL